MTELHDNVLSTIGHTPIIRLNNCVPDLGYNFFAKVEFFNPGASVKDRVALAIIEEGERSGALRPGGTIIEATSGNTGVGLAMVAAIKGYKCIFVMPDKISEEKRATLRAYGARVVITPTSVEPEDPRSFYSVARKFVEITPNSFYANQYHNPANPQRHYETTGPEVWDQTGGKVDCFVGGAGTGGTLSGVGKYLKEKKPEVKIVCADPIGSLLFDMFYYKEVRDKIGGYFVEGIGEDFMPDNMQFQYFDDIVKVEDPELFQLTRKISQTEGLLVGPSCGAALMGAIKYAQSGKLKKGANIVVLFPDGGRSYLSKAYNEDWMREKNLLPPTLGSFKVGDLVKAMPHRKSEATVQVGTSIKDAVHVIREHGLTQVPTYSDKAFVGMVEVADLLLTLASARLRPDEPVLHIVKSSLFEVAPAMNLLDLEKTLLREPYVLVKELGAYITRADLAEFVGKL